MLDLDSLADQRAQSLNEQKETWRAAVWDAAFQTLSASMSDGEVEELLRLSPSVGHLQNAVRFLETQSRARGLPPFKILTDEANAAGLSPAEWMAQRGDA